MKGTLIIPPITEDLGKTWAKEQPQRENLHFDDIRVHMSKEDFNRLREYSTSQPTGCYPGKMWKSNEFHHVQGRMVFKNIWWLCWFAPCPKNPEKYCVTKYKQILVRE